MNSALTFRIGALLAVALLATPAYAQTPPAAVPALQGSPIPRIAPTQPLPTAPPVAPTPLPPETLPNAAVAVSSVSIEGATAYPAAKLQALTQGLVGPNTSLAAIEAARRAILLLYRNDGYPFVLVSVRFDTGHVLHVAVAEGYISDVKLSGDVGPAGTLVLKFLDHLTEERPINNDSIERWLLLAQSIPGLTIQPVIQPSEREPGAFTLVARVTRALVNGSFAADNRAFPKSGSEEGLLTVGVNSLTELGERTEASFYLAGPDGHQLFGQASEQFFVGGSGLSVRLYGGAGDTLPCCDLHQIGYDGRSIVFGAEVSYPLLLRRQQQLYLRGSFDALDTDTLEQDSRASGDSLRVLRGGADYGLTDTVLGTDFAGTSTVSVRVSQGLSAFGASSNGRGDAGRLNENTAFTKFSAEFTRDQTLITLADGTRISLFGLAAGQGTGDILPSSEQFYLGGLRYTRGFYSGEVVGDNALALSAELRVSSSFVTDLFGTSLAITPQFYGFCDWGETWQNQATDANQRLESYGIGIRTGITQHVRLELEALRRITRQVGGVDVKPLPADAVYWRVVTTF
jgi:hemolysin activation/secretion protein